MIARALGRSGVGLGPPYISEAPLGDYASHDVHNASCWPSGLCFSIRLVELDTMLVQCKCGGVVGVSELKACEVVTLQHRFGYLVRWHKGNWWISVIQAHDSRMTPMTLNST